MKLTFTGQRVLAIVAHPDDAELLCAGTLARARDDGAPIGLCVLCRGDKGQPAEPVPNLATLRRREVQDAARLLGAELLTGGIPDGTLTDDPPTRGKLLELVRRFRPTLILAHASNDYHSDHRAASALAEAVSWTAASRGQKSRSAPLDAPPALWWMDTIEMHAFEPGFYIDVSEHAELKHAMLACHRSQIQRSGDHDFTPLANLLTRQMTTRGAQSGVPAAEAFRAHAAFKRMRAW